MHRRLVLRQNTVNTHLPGSWDNSGLMVSDWVFLFIRMRTAEVFLFVAYSSTKSTLTVNLLKLATCSEPAVCTHVSVCRRVCVCLPVCQMNCRHHQAVMTSQTPAHTHTHMSAGDMTVSHGVTLGQHVWPSSSTADAGPHSTAPNRTTTPQYSHVGWGGVGISMKTNTN